MKKASKDSPNSPKIQTAAFRLFFFVWAVSERCRLLKLAGSYWLQVETLTNYDMRSKEDPFTDMTWNFPGKLFHAEILSPQMKNLRSFFLFVPCLSIFAQTPVGNAKNDHAVPTILPGSSHWTLFWIRRPREDSRNQKADQTQVGARAEDKEDYIRIWVLLTLVNCWRHLNKDKPQPKHKQKNITCVNKCPYWRLDLAVYAPQHTARHSARVCCWGTWLRTMKKEKIL